MELAGFLRTKKGCFRRHDSRAWGSWYKIVEDPKGVEVPVEQLTAFYLRENFPKLPLEDLRRIVTFYRRYITNLSPHSRADTNEVQVCLLRDTETLNNWKVLVPRQEISPVTVEAITSESCDLETGEEYRVFPPEGYAHAGSSHSHNTMSSFFSSKDDAGEINVPGLHFVIGNITKTSFSIKASIVVQQRRYIIDPREVIEFADVLMETKGEGVSLTALVVDDVEVSFSDTVHTYVSKPTSAATRKYKYNSTKKPKAAKPLSYNDLYDDFEPPARWGWADDLPLLEGIMEEEDGEDQLIAELDILLERMMRERRKPEQDVIALLYINGYIGTPDATALLGGESLATAVKNVTQALSNE